MSRTVPMVNLSPDMSPKMTRTRLVHAQVNKNVQHMPYNTFCFKYDRASFFEEMLEKMYGECSSMRTLSFFSFKDFSGTCKRQTMVVKDISSFYDRSSTQGTYLPKKLFT